MIKNFCHKPHDCYEVHVSISADLEKNYQFLYTGGDTEIQKI